jgi:translation initiation factor IF-2
MPEAEKTIRLNKAAKEFNLSMDHIVDFLSKKGFKIESNPNTKLPGDAYSLLLKEFQSDKSAKEEAIQLTQSKLRKDTPVVLEAEDLPKTVSRKVEESKEILIKNMSAAHYLKDDVAKAEKEKEKELKSKAEKETAAKEVKEKEIKDKEAKEKEIKEKEAREKKEKETVVIKAKADKVEGPKVLGKIDIAEEPPKKKKKPEPEPEAKPVKEKKAAEKPEKKVTKKKKDPAEEELPVAPVQEEIIEAPVAEVKTETPEPLPAETEAPAETDDKKDDIHRIERTKLSGPTVLGKIELPTEQPKRKPVASSSGAVDDKKKKRKRTERKSSGTPIPQDKRQQGGDFNRPIQRARPNQPRPQEKSEPTEKEIQDQIKATLARLSGSGKSRSSKLRKARRDVRAEEKEAAAAEQAENKVIQVTEFVTANDLARMMNVTVTEIISACMALGIFVSINQRLDAETLTVVAEEFGYKVEFVSADVQETIGVEADSPEDLTSRSPIVTSHF